MDLKARLKDLEEAHAAGLLNGIEFNKAKNDLLNEQSSRDEPSPRVSRQNDRENSLSYAVPSFERLERGLEIGPADHRFRLLRPLGNKLRDRVWLAQRLSAEAGSIEDSFRALKIFAPRNEDIVQAQRVLERTGRGTSRVNLTNLLRTSLARFRTRSELISRFSHPNIVKVHGWRQGEDGWPFVEMDYLDHRTGRNLRKLLDQEGKPGLEWRRVLTLLRPIAAALDYAHQEHRLAHRDLKPENVFITDEGDVRLLDFGLTYQPRQTRGGAGGEEPNTLLLGMMSGAPAVAPVSDLERFRQDICALAALAYELLTGRPPYRQEVSGQEEIDTKVLIKPMALTEAAWLILRECLTERETEFPGSASELVQKLGAAQGNVHDNRRIVLSIGSTVLGISLIAGLLWYIWKPFAGNDQAEDHNLQELAEEVEQTPRQGSAGVTTTIDQLDADEREQDDRAFAAAQRQGTPAAYRLYLQRCPDCAHREEAEAALKELQQQTKSDALKARFEAYFQTDRITREKAEQALAVLEELRRLDPQAPFIAAGRRRVAEVYGELARASLGAGDYGQARRWLEQGRQLQPDLALWSTLAAAIDQGQTQTRDAAAYARARERDTQQAYQAYLADCAPDCAYEDQARAALERLKAAPPSLTNPLFRDALADGGQGPEMVLIPAGRFRMGSPPDETGRYSDEHPHSVTIAQPFAIGRHEVTFADYDRFAQASGRPLPADEGWGRGLRPVINVSWHDAQAYAAWLSEQTGQRYRLPTEAEWEYAARVGTESARFWGPDPDQGCRYANGADLTGKEVFSGWPVMDCRDGFIYTAPVGQYQSNDYKLYDMLGNVLEWSCSTYDAQYEGAEQRCAPSGTRQRIVARGGSWSDQPRDLRAAVRYHTDPDSQDYFLGFRLVRESQ